MANVALQPLSDIVRRPHPIQTKFQTHQERRRQRQAMIADLRATVGQARHWIETDQEEHEVRVFAPLLDNLITQLLLLDGLEKLN